MCSSDLTLGTPRRAAVGWDMARLNMVMAVLEARADLAFGGHDIYLNVAGGLRAERGNELADERVAREQRGAAIRDRDPRARGWRGLRTGRMRTCTKRDGPVTGTQCDAGRGGSRHPRATPA